MTGWESELEGDGLEQVGEESYILEIEPEKVAQIVTTIRPRTPSGLSASIHAGSAIPLPTPSSNFASDYGAGYCGIIDLGYSLNPRSSLVLMAGYNYFPSAASGVDDMSVLNVSLNGKYAIPLRPKTDICLGAGLELFLVDFDTLEYGYDALLAYDYELSKRLTLEIGAVYHSRFDQEVWFMQAHAGLIYKF